MTTTTILEVFDIEEQKHVDAEKRDVRDIKKSFRIEQYGKETLVVAVARHKLSEMNYPIEISAEEGKPLTYEAYDVVKDCFHVLGVSNYEIGHIPVSYIASFDGVPWREYIPLPPSVIRRYMDEHQKKTFDAWKSSFKSPTYSIVYVQMLQVN